MTAATFDDEQKADLPRNLKGNLCRCTGYRAIEDAVCGQEGHPDPGRPRARASPARASPEPAARAAGRRRSRTRQPRRRHGAGPLHPGRPGRGTARAAAPEAAALAARPRPDPLHRHRGRAGDSRRAWPSSPTRTPRRSCSPPPSTSSTPTTRTTPGVLDDVVRFIGQRVAAVVAERWRRRKRACAPLGSTTRCWTPSSPRRTPCCPAPRPPRGQGRRHGPHRRPERNVVAELHAELGDVAAGFAAADFIHEQTYRTQRVQHAALETHASIASLDDDGRLQIRTSSQVPFLVRRTLCRRVRPAGGADPRGGRPGGRRLRRQAGGAHRGRRRAGGPEAAAARCSWSSPGPSSSPPPPPGTRSPSISRPAPAATAG